MRAASSAVSSFERARRGPLSFGILSTFPPTPCGLATFSAALANGLSQNGAAVGVVRVADGTHQTSDRVIGELVNGSAQSVAAASGLLNRSDVAVVQHEYGLYGGPDGDEVLKILANLRVPSIVVAHTILRDPTPHQRSVLVEVAALAGRVVVMSEAANQRLCGGFDIDPAKVTTIPHGAAIPVARTPSGPGGHKQGPAGPGGHKQGPAGPGGHKQGPAGPGGHKQGPPSRPQLLTWGLLGPGKGIERVVDAMQSLHDLPMRPRYLVAGQTHPKVLAADGEAYRNARIKQAWRNGVAASVTFDASYRSVASLTALIQSSAVVVLPYDSTDQVTSGVLVDAIAAGRPVVATAFPHAVELLGSGAGLVVDHGDPEAMARALQRVLTEPDLAAGMAAEASRLAPLMGWGVVAQAYMALADQVRVERLASV